MAHFTPFISFQSFFLVIIIEKSQKSMKLQLTEQSCVLKKISMSKIPTNFED